MMSHRLRHATALGSAAFVATLLASASPAFAQTSAEPATIPPAPKDQPEAQTGDENIVVTGSRIRRPGLDSAVPVTTISGKAFFETGVTSIGDTLNDLPALRSTFSQSNSTRFLGTAGLNLLDLRGLGTQRTLVLVNGRRHVAGDVLNNATSTDVNTIPTDLIERVDVVTGGDSAVYGSDALAGVVNFILKEQYNGIQLRGQGGISQHGDAGGDFVSLLAGKNFADGRGNVAVNLEYAHQEDFYASDRAEYRTVNGFVQVRNTGIAGSPQSIFVNDIRNGVYSNAGTFLTYFGGSSYTPVIFQPNGTLVAQTGTPVGLAPTPRYIGGSGDNFRDGTQFAFRPRLDRYSVNLVGHFEVSPAFIPFVEATFTRTKSFGSASGPFFTNALGERFRTDNPYLSNQARGIIRDYYGDYYTGAGRADGPDGISDADQYGFGFYKNAVDLTNRTEAATRDTYRIVAGVKGDFNNDWHYEVSANYGQFKEHTQINGNVNLQRYFLSIDAVDQGLARGGPANGNIVCRASVSAAAAAAANAGAIGAGVDATYANAQLAGDVAACVPVNLFGSGNVTSAARNYMLQNSIADGKLTQFVLSAFVNGDTSGFFNLPGGPVGFVLGAEYRRETNFYQQDAATAAAATFYNAIPLFNPPSFEVKEAYAELRIPLFKDVPFIKELTLNGAGRVADYKGGTGTVYSYNGGVEYAPVSGLRFRGNYSRAVRAPNLSDQYTPLGQNFFGFNDPCSLRNRASGSQFRAANCAAAGVPAAYDFVYQSTPGYLSGGNPALKAEKSDSYTIGGVFQPRFVPGFSFSADYYSITVRDVINTPGPQAIIDACYDLPTLANQFCAAFRRDTTRPLTQGQYVNNSLAATPLNYAKLVVSGIDFDAGYEHTFGKIGKFSIHGIYTLALKASNFLDPTNPTFEDRTLSELGDPQNTFNIDMSLQHGPLTLGYKMQYIDKQTNGAYERYFSVQGRAPTNPNAVAPQYRLYPVITYHNVRAELAVNDKFNVYMGVDNVFDQLPPFGLSGAGGGSAIYPNVGRYLYTGVQAKF